MFALLKKCGTSTVHNVVTIHPFMQLECEIVFIYLVLLSLISIPFLECIRY